MTEKITLSSVAPEILPIAQAIISVAGEQMDTSDPAAIRVVHDQFARAGLTNIPEAPDVEQEKIMAPGPADNPEVPVVIYRPAGKVEPLPVLIWLHGGGLIMGIPEQDTLLLREFCRQVGCVVVSVDYRLAPEHPYPAALHDNYAVLEWLHREHQSLGIDPTRIAVGGSSAGGGLAATLAIEARNRGEISLCYQVLLYPMLDDTRIADAEGNGPQTLLWSSVNNRDGWKAYLGDIFETDQVPETAAAHRVKDVSGLPPAVIAVGDIDLFLSEDLNFAQRMIAVGIPVDVRVYSGAFHGFLMAALHTSIAQRCVQSFVDGLKGAFSL